MRARVWGARGSLAVSGPEYFRHGGNTSCIEVRAADDSIVVLDAGTGLRRLGDSIPTDVERVDLLLTHFHVDHLFGFGFFPVLFRPDVEVHVWGPSTDTRDLRASLNRYLSPPLFPVRLPDLPSRVVLHDTPTGTFDLPGMQVTADLVNHPGRTFGYRLDDGTGTMAYLSDHEPALGADDVSGDPAWVSGAALAAGVDLLVHDAQYRDDEYPRHVGWGHSSVSHVLAFTELVGARHLLAFHHDPGHDDYHLQDMWADVKIPAGVRLTVAAEGQEHVAAASPAGGR